jgi:hypothetical protein
MHFFKILRQHHTWRQSRRRGRSIAPTADLSALVAGFIFHSSFRRNLDTKKRGSCQSRGTALDWRVPYCIIWTGGEACLHQRFSQVLFQIRRFLAEKLLSRVANSCQISVSIVYYAYLFQPFDIQVCFVYGYQKRHAIHDNHSSWRRVARRRRKLKPCLSSTLFIIHSPEKKICGCRRCGTLTK